MLNRDFSRFSTKLTPMDSFCWLAAALKRMVTMESAMQGLEMAWDRLWGWVRQHPLTAAAAAVVLIAALGSPSARNAQTPGAHPPVDLGSDEPPLFI